MEERPWTKSEFFAWSDGRRIVDLYELSKQLHCKQCRSLLDLGRTEREARYGLASVLYILCNCGVMNDVHTGRTQQDGGASNSPNLMYEINIKASINLLMYGAGASRILSFLALLDIPVPPPDDTSLIVPVTEDMQNTSSTLSLPPPPSSTPASTATATGPSTKAASSDSTAPFQKAPPPSAAPSSFTPEPGFRPVPLPPGDDDDEDNDNTLPDDVDNEDEDDDEDDDMDDDDEEYVPVSKSKPKPKPSPAPKKKSLLRGPKSARAKQAAKIAAKKKPPVKLKVKIKKEKEETPKKVAEEEEKQDDDQSGEQYMDPMDWSSSETETESATGKNKNSDDSWHEDDDDYKEEEAGSRPKRKRGRPRGTPEKTKRTRRSAEHKTKEEKSSPKKKRVKAEGKEAPRCTTCSKEFTSVKGYNVHMKRVHNQEMKGSSGAGGEGDTWHTVKEEKVTDCLYLCPSCTMVFSQAKCLSVHLKKMHPEMEDCSNVERYGLSLEGSVLRLKRVWKSRHLISYKCLKCDTILPFRRKFAQHIRVNTQSKQITCLKFSAPGDEALSNYQCDLFLTDGLKKSQALCYTCGEIFSDKSAFLNHIETHGEVVEKRFVCELCPYATHVQCYLRYHTKHKHPTGPRVRSHICEHCGKAFYEKLVLDEHVKYTHLRKRKFVCDVCSKVFYRPGTLAKHKRCHTGKRPYVCSQCGQSFTVAYNLKVHQRLHTGERPYQCKQCDAAFAQKNSLDVHMRKHKKQEAGDWAPREASKARNQGETTKTPMAPPAHSNTGYPQYSGAVFPSYPLPAYPYYHNL